MGPMGILSYDPLHGSGLGFYRRAQSFQKELTRQTESGLYDLFLRGSADFVSRF